MFVLLVAIFSVPLHKHFRFSLLRVSFFSVSRGRHHHDGLGRAPGRGRKSSTSSTGHIAFNKEHYLLATCQFVVHSSVDPTPYLDNPDLLVDWSVVEQVRDVLYGHWIGRGNQKQKDVKKKT